MNKYERARIISARAFQLSLNAQPNIKVKGKNVIDPIQLSVMEFENNLIPLKIRRKIE